MTRKVVLAVLLVGIGIGVEAQAAVLCKDKTTKALFVRAQCKPNEKQLDPVALGLKGPSGTGLVLYDANDKKVGDVVDLSSLVYPVVIFRVDEHVFALRVTRSRFIGESPLWFASTDCSGPPLLEVNEEESFDLLLSNPVIGSPGHTVYVPDLNAVVQSVLVKSFLRQVGQCLPDNATKTVVSAIPIVDLDTQFTPPFSVR